MVGKTMSHRPTCETCPFWSVEALGGDPVAGGEWGSDNPNGNSGECRRHAPRRMEVDCPTILRNSVKASGLPFKQSDLEESEWEESRGIFPLTYAWNWCGEHSDMAAWIKERQ